MSNVTIQTVSPWYRPTYCVASGKTYRVDKFIFFHPELKEVVLTYNHSWLEDTRGQDIKLIELPQTELKRKTKANLSLNEAFVISLGKEDYGTDYLCELYIPTNMLNIKFVEHKVQGGYLYAYWAGDQDILIKEYKGNIGQYKSSLRHEYEDLLEQVSGYNLEYHTINTLDNIQLLYKKALEFNNEAERVKNLTIDEAITEVMQSEK